MAAKKRVENKSQSRLNRTKKLKIKSKKSKKETKIPSKTKKTIRDIKASSVKKTTKKTTPKKVTRIRKKAKNLRFSEIFKKIDWSQSYVSLILGIVVVAVIVMGAFSFYNARNSFFTKLPTPTSSPTILKNVDKKVVKTHKTTNQTGKITGNTYTVEQGDSLVDIAQRAYGNPDKWVDIANVNNLTEPDILNPGQIIKIPR